VLNVCLFSFTVRGFQEAEVLGDKPLPVLSVIASGQYSQNCNWLHRCRVCCCG